MGRATGYDHKQAGRHERAGTALSATRQRAPGLVEKGWE
jgi:hypothetical protein